MFLVKVTEIDHHAAYRSRSSRMNRSGQPGPYYASSKTNLPAVRQSR